MVMHRTECFSAEIKLHNASVHGNCMAVESPICIKKADEPSPTRFADIRQLSLKEDTISFFCWRLFSWQLFSWLSFSWPLTSLLYDEW
jgi:hypothetical protein